jgi:branched-chain amino acid aminotransferase
MNFKYFSKDGQLLPQDQATIPLSNIAYQYGFGVYETLKVRNNILYFLDQHVDRLIHSAEQLDMLHGFTRDEIKKYIQELVDVLAKDSDNPKFSCNLKMLLIGGAKKDEDAQLFILALDPLYPNRKFYKQGVKTVTVNYQRALPNVKSLNMLMSFLAYRKAGVNECYDALLLDHNGHILEGTRTNFYVIKDKTIISPLEKDILEGVTRQTVLSVAKKNGYKVVEKDIPFSEIKKNAYDGAFLTSTSSKIVPINQIDDFHFEKISEDILNLIKLYDTFLDESQGVFKE